MKTTKLLAKQIADRKAAVSALAAKLQTIAALIPEDGNYAALGSLEHLEETLLELVSGFRPVLVQDEMTIWFPLQRMRDEALKEAAAATADSPSPLPRAAVTRDERPPIR